MRMEPKKPDSAAELTINASINEVFGVLADPYSYAYWVVGSDEIRAADNNWPAKGSEFKHTVGVWPLKSHDHSYVEEVDEPRLLRLRVKARPFVDGRVWLELSKFGNRTRVAMYEDAANTLSKLVLNPLTQPLVRLRNEAALRRLAELATNKRPSRSNPAD